MKKLVATAVLLFVAASASAKTKRVQIYFVPWEVTTVIAMSADVVRASAKVKIEILDPESADRFVRSLAEEKMKPDPQNSVGDIRLVIDAEQDDGSIWSYHASRFALRAERSGKTRSINASFRAHFSFLYGEKG